ncbi:pyridoxal phosphate-dependent aminotransferase [Coralliovum pocilloporae]|uniref:pyridoxal phosphate-dependent aminotransferase n=1 Tax=Coralliovum pocilloporae TaxID=3066369 RepID=UPI003307B3B8
MPIKPSLRSAVEPFLAMDVLQRAGQLERAGRSILHMEVGQPGAPVPQPVRDAAAAALRDGRIGYTEALGIRPLRERISRYYQDRFGVSVSPDRIAITTGSSGGFNLAFLAALNPGDRVVMPTPAYPAYRNVLNALGLVPVEVPVTEDTRWALTPDQLLALHDEEPVHAVLIASPANPSGTVMQSADFQFLIDACSENNILFISDEIYHGLVFEGAEETALGHSDDALIINSFSKYYCMTGWRIGWMVLPEVLVRPVERIAQSLYISAPELSQRAAIAAFDATDELEQIKDGYRRNRARLLDAFPKIGIPDFLPVDGAFYLYANVGHLTDDSARLSAALLEDIGLAVTPGADFDQERGARYLRFSFAGTEAAVEEAIERLGGWLSAKRNA